MDENEKTKKEVATNEVKTETTVADENEAEKVVEQLKQEETGYTTNGVVDNPTINSTYTDNSSNKINVLGLISFIFSLIGLLVAGIPCGIVALTTGIIGLVKFNPNTEKSKWMAITGIVVGAVDIVFVLFYLGTMY